MFTLLSFCSNISNKRRKGYSWSFREGEIRCWEGFCSFWKKYNYFINIICLDLLNGKNFLCGTELTLADISACCEMMQLDMIKYNFNQFPKTNAWLHRVISVPEIHQAHNVAFKIIKNKNPSS